MVALDLDGDGKIDLAAASNGVILVFPGNGDGTFQSPLQTATGTVSAFPHLAYADLNGDGKVDLVIADSANSALYVAMGNGNGTFQSPRIYAASSHLQSVTPIPLGDGDTALLVPDGAFGGLTAAFVDAAGNVGLPPVQVLQVASPRVSQSPPIAAADLNGDQKPDLVIASPTGVSVLLNKGNESFGSPVPYVTGALPLAMVAADFNRDGKPDILVMSQSGASILLGNGDGTMRAARPVSGLSLSTVTVADFNGDGIPDFAAGNASSISVFLGNGDGTFRAGSAISATLAGSLQSGDFNADGKPDLVAASGQGSAIALYLGNGDGTFRTPLAVPAAGSVFAAGDLNGDGKLDLVVFTAGGEFAVLLGNGGGTFQARATPALGQVTSLQIIDLNGDGKPDLVLGNCCGNAEASFAMGNGDGTFGDQEYFPSGPNPGAIAIANYYDGKPGLAISGFLGISTTSTTLTLLATRFSLPAQVFSSANASLLSVAPGSLVSIYGQNLATSVAGSTPLPLPASFGGTSVSIVDSAGTAVAAPLVYVSPGQVNIEVPPGLASGAARLTVTSGNGTLTSATIQIVSVAPGLFVLNSNALVAADTLLVNGTSQIPGNVYNLAADGTVVAQPIILGPAGSTTYLILFGTGLHAAGTSGVTVIVGGVNCTVIYAGTQGSFAGLDQVNVVLPQSLAGSGNVTIQLTANGIPANPVKVTIQ